MAMLLMPDTLFADFFVYLVVRIALFDGIEQCELSDNFLK